MTKGIFKFSAFFACLLMLGCTSTSSVEYDNALQTWVGQSERDLVLKWGIPDRDYQLDKSTRLIAYKQNRQVYYPGTVSSCAGGYHGGYGRGRGHGVGIGMHFDPMGCMGGSPPYAENRSCETTFTIIKGTITAWQHKGNDCRL